MEGSDLERMEAGQPSQGNVPLRPYGTPYSVSTTSSASENMIYQESTALQPAFPAAGQATISFSSSSHIGPMSPNFMHTHPGVSINRTFPTPHTSHIPATASTGLPQHPTLAQVPRPWPSGMEQRALCPQLRPSAGLLPNHMISRPQQPTLQSIDPVPSATNASNPSLASPLHTGQPNSQPASSTPGPTYCASSASTLPKIQQTNEHAGSELASICVASYAHPVGYASERQMASGHVLASKGNFVRTPVGAYLGNQMQQTASGPPMEPVVGNVENFHSLSFGSSPGSTNTGIDLKALPRPLESDIEADSFAKIHPMNFNSRYLRFSTYAIPNSCSLLSRWHLPLGAIICPLAQASDGEEVPVVDFPSSVPGIPCCIKCGTCWNPYITLGFGGQKWQCNICTFVNSVPHAYLDLNGDKVDLAERPELKNVTVEYKFLERHPFTLMYLFLIDVSMHAVRSGMLQVVADAIKSCLDSLSGLPNAQIGFITFDSRIHFYNLKSTSLQPEMMVVSDLEDIFVPLPANFIVNLDESRNVVDAFLDGLCLMFQKTMDMESAFGPAVKAALMTMNKASGRLLIFQHTLPSTGVGHLRLRSDDHHVYGTDREQILRLPQDPFYLQMASNFATFKVSVDLYAFSDNYMDIASLGTLSKYTGGQVYYYPSFQSAIHKEKLKSELSRNLTRETAWDPIMLVLCTKGVRLNFTESLSLRDNGSVSLPPVTCNKAFAAFLSLEEPLLTPQCTYFQVSLIYTSSSGERRTRVHTAAVPVVTTLGDMYQHADIGAIITLFCTLAIEKCLSHKLEEARGFIQHQIVLALREYQNRLGGQHRPGSSINFPEALKFLPLFGFALCKSVPLRGGYGDAELDERSAMGNIMLTLSVKRLLKLLYPNLFRVDQFLQNVSEIDDFDQICKSLPLSAESLDEKGLYLYDDGFRFIIWFGRMLSPDVTFSLLGEEFPTDYSKVILCEHDNQMSRKLLGILSKLRDNDSPYYQLPLLVRQGEEPRESIHFRSNLAEDRFGSLDGIKDWIQRICQQVQKRY